MARNALDATLPRIEAWWVPPRFGGESKERPLSLGTILLIVLVLMLLGVLPTWPHSRSWGYGPSGIVGVIVVILLILFLTGRL